MRKKKQPVSCRVDFSQCRDGFMSSQNFHKIIQPIYPNQMYSLHNQNKNQIYSKHNQITNRYTKIRDLTWFVDAVR